MGGTRLKLGAQELNPKLLQEWPENPRKISKPRLAALVASMRAEPKMFDARPLIVTQAGIVVAGNMRLRAALELNWARVPVYVAKLDNAQAREWALRDNNNYGEWDDIALAQLIRDMQAAEQDISLTGFTEADVKKLLSESPLPDAQDAPSQAPPAVYGVVAECADEASQQVLLERLLEDGYICRALSS